MPTIPPQKIPQNIPPRIFTRLNTCLADLVHTESSPPGAVEQFLPNLRDTIPAGARRDCLHAAILLLDGQWNLAHQRCQEVRTPYGAAWHGLLHRLEGDYWNSNYWWRQAHRVKWTLLADELTPLFNLAPPPISEEMKGSLRPYSPEKFVSLVQRHLRDPAWRESLVEIQRWEWAALYLETHAHG